jgi:hypothetical protein
MNIEKIIAFLKEHEGEQAMLDFLSGLKLLTSETVKGYLETDDGKRLIQPMMDAYFTKGLDTFKEKTLPGLVEELHNKKYPPEDDRDKELRELREEVRAEKQQREKAERRTATLQKMSDSGLSDFIELVDRFTADTPEETDTHIKTMSEKLKTVVDAEVEKRMKLNKPPKPGDDDPNKTEQNPWKAETKNLTKQAQLLKTDPEKAAKLMAEAGVKP